MTEEHVGDISRNITRSHAAAPGVRSLEHGGMSSVDQELNRLQYGRLAAVVLADQEVHSGQIGQPVRLEPTESANCKRL